MEKMSLSYRKEIRLGFGAILEKRHKIGKHKTKNLKVNFRFFVLCL